MKKTFLGRVSEDKRIADAHNPLIPSHDARTHWFALGCLLVTLGVGPVQAGGVADGIFDNGFEVLPPSVIDPDWQLLYGYESNGIASDQEGVIGVETDTAGNVYSLVDRRFDDDPNDRNVLLLTVDSTGMLTNALRLRFESSVSPIRFKRTRDGNFLLLVEQDELIKISPTGQPIWARTLERDPFAFGGLEIWAINDDSAGNIYFAGSFTPSEPDLRDERGFVAKLDSDGNGLWMRSWDQHRSSFEGTGLAVSDDGNAYVTDHIDGTNFDIQRVVLAFAPDGTAIGQALLLRDTSNGPVAAATTVAPIAEGSGVTIVGFRNILGDNDAATLVYRTTFDSSLLLTANAGTRLESEGNLFPIIRTSAVSRSADGSLRLGVGNNNDVYGVVALGVGAASAFKLERTDGTTPYVDDSDYPVHVASGPNNELYIGGTSEQPGMIRLAPVASAIATVPLRVEDAGYTINVETLIVIQEATEFTVDSDTLGVVDEPQDGDADALFLRVTLP